MNYLLQCWYQAAWANEIPAGKALARRILNEPVVLFRDASGQPQALLDRCPHRFAPLSRGVVGNGAIACGYHGLAFAGDGACVTNPHGPVLKNMSVRAFPVVEAFRSIWIWMGDPAKADTALLPPLNFVDETPNTAFSMGYVRGAGNYQLFVDNILDLTHADYLHPTTLGGGSLTRARAKVAEAADRISIRWHCANEKPTPLMARILNDPEHLVDAWTEVDWIAPAIMTLRTGAVRAGSPREAGGNALNLHIMTPETERTTHYFYASTRDFAVDDAAFNEEIAKTRRQIFATEDKPMIEAQQDRMGDAGFWELNPILLRTDEGAVRVRRRMDEMLAKEMAS